MKNKILTVLLAGMMAISLGACGEKTDEQNDKSGGTSDSPMTQTESEDNLYTLQVQITSSQTAEILIQGVSVDDSAEGALWGVEFDDTYSVYLDNYENTIQCSACETEEDGGRRLIKEMDYIIAGSSLRIIADFSGTDDFDFYNTSTYTLIVDEEGDGYRPIELVAADVVVDSLTYEYAGDENKEDQGRSENLEIHQEEENAQGMPNREEVKKQFLNLFATGQPYEESDFPVNEGDEIHFKPMTDDYSLRMFEEGDEYICVNLFSYDEEGKACQLVEKKIYVDEGKFQEGMSHSDKSQAVGMVIYTDYSATANGYGDKVERFNDIYINYEEYDGNSLKYAADSNVKIWFSKFGSAEQEMAAEQFTDSLFKRMR